MAIKKVIEIDVDQVQAMGGLDALQQSLVETETKSASLKAELRKLKEQLAQLPEGSEEYNKIAKQAGEVSDKIGDINTRIKNLGSDTKNIDAVVQGTQALSGAFSVATSASALLGEENKDLQETMLKVESAIGLTVGVQSIANALQKESALAIGLSNVATTIQIGLQRAYALVVGTTTGALKALRVALVSTGVGALVVALGYLVSKMTESSDATAELSEKQKELNADLERTKELTDAVNKSIDFSTKIALASARERGASQDELRKIEIDGVNRRLKANTDEINSIKSTQDEEFKLTKEQNKRIQDLRAQNLDLVSQGRIQVAEWRAEDAEKEREDADAKSKKLSDDAKAEAKRLEDERKAREKAELEERIRFENAKGRLAEEAFDKIVQTEADAKEKNRIAGLTEIEQTQQKYDALIEQARQANVSTVELEIEKANAINEINLGIQAEEQKVRLAQKEADEKALADKKILKEQELALSAETFGKVATLLGKNSKIGKAFAVGQALMNTYQGITAELATKAVTPYEIGLKVANIAFVASTGFKAVKQILATNPMSSGGGASTSGGASGGGASATPQFNLVGQSSTNQLTATIAGQQNRPVQTFVVGSQVSTQQALDRNAVANSVFG